MRPPTKKLPLSLETVFQTMVPGREYTVTVIRRLYEGTNDQIDAVLQAGIVNGMLDRSGENVRGFKQRYWRREEFEKPMCGVAERRTGPNEVEAALSGYDLLKNARLCNNFRRS